MANPISVNHGNLDVAASMLSAAGADMKGDAKAVKAASERLLGGWTGTGRSAFSTASTTLVAFMEAAATIVSAESQSLRKANQGFEEQDAKTAAGVSSVGQ